MIATSRGSEIFIKERRWLPAHRHKGGETAASAQMVIEFSDSQAAQVVLNALEAYRARLEAGIARTKRRLEAFEQRYGVTTPHFLAEMVAEDLSGGDLEYVEWAGEAQLLEGLERELRQLEHARRQVAPADRRCVLPRATPRHAASPRR